MEQEILFPFAAADHLFAPIELPSPDTDLDSFLEQCNQRVNQLICQAWQTGALPSSTSLVQCITKPAIGRRVDFTHPWILRTGMAQPERVRLLAAFAHTTWHLQRRKASSHARLRDLGDTSRGAVVLFTRELPESAWPAGLSHILHFGFPATRWGEPLGFEECDEILSDGKFSRSEELGSFAKGFEAFDGSAFNNHAKNKQFHSIIRDRPAPAKWNGVATAAFNAELPERITRDLFQDIRNDEQYQDRVRVLLECGTIVLCAPQSFSFPQSPLSKTVADKGTIFDSGLTVILADNRPPTASEINQIHGVAHNVSLLIASTYGLATTLSHESQIVTSRNIVSWIGHGLRNTFTKTQREGQQLERCVRLETIRLQAASVLFDPSLVPQMAISWERGGHAEESLSTTLHEGLFHGSRAIVCSWPSFRGMTVDVRFIALLLELGQNLYRHSGSGSIVVSATADSSESFDIALDTKISGAQAANLLDRLKSSHLTMFGQDLHGWDFILMLLFSLTNSSSGSLRITLCKSDGHQLLQLDGEHTPLGFKLNLPETSEDFPDNLAMTIRVHGLSVAIQS